MIRLGMEYTIGVVAVGLLVTMVGGLWVGRGGIVGVAWGASTAVALQAALFWLLFLRVRLERRGLAYGAGILVRFMAVILMAFFGVAAVGASAAPTLFSMVACLFGSTLLEALFIQRREMGKAGTGAVTIRT
ncbi:MAG: hypothetical protein GEU90_06775 [Gemmatimonas sp.]|nr:hypothetical protein [Gemmatimonas sp.]